MVVNVNLVLLLIKVLHGMQVVRIIIIMELVHMQEKLVQQQQHLRELYRLLIPNLMEQLQIVIPIVKLL